MQAWTRLARTAKRKHPKATDGPAESTLEKRAKKAVHRRSGGHCEIRTPWCLGPATNFSHRRADGQGGLWTASNGLDSCGWGNATGCHGYCHQHPEEARKNGWFISAFLSTPTTEVETLIHSRYGHTWVLLDDEGDLTLAPFPDGSSQHPDRLSSLRPLDVDGAA